MVRLNGRQNRPDSSRRSATLVDVAPVPNLDNDHHENIILDLVDDTV